MVRVLPCPERRAAAPDQVEIDHVNPPGWTALLEAIILAEATDATSEVDRLLIDAGAHVEW